MTSAQGSVVADGVNAPLRVVLEECRSFVSRRRALVKSRLYILSPLLARGFMIWRIVRFTGLTLLFGFSKPAANSDANDLGADILVSRSWLDLPVPHVGELWLDESWSGSEGMGARHWQDCQI